MQRHAGWAALCVIAFVFCFFSANLFAEDGVLLLQEVRNAPKANAIRSQRFTELLNIAGCPVNIISRQRVMALGRGGNVYVFLKGRRAPEDVIVVGAHTDTLEGSRGVVDNWSSCVMLAELYRLLSVEGTDRSFIFVGFTGEEHGQHGSQGFVQLLNRKFPSRVRAMVNLECLGVGVLRTWANGSADDMEMIFRASSDAVDIPFDTQVLFGYKSDAISFCHAGIPSVTIHSLDGPQLAKINNAGDDGTNIDFKRYLQAAQQLHEFLKRLDSYDGDIRLADSDSGLKPVRSHLRVAQSESREKNALVLGPMPSGSIEYRSGLRNGDILMSIDGMELSRPLELRPTLLTLHRGRSVNMSVLRSMQGNTQMRQVDLTVAY